MTRLITPIVLVLLFSCGLLEAQVTADFTFSDPEGCASLQVSFCDNSSSTAGAIVAWNWNLGGAISALECPGRVFSTPGNYTICLTATDDQGNSDQICRTDLIKVFDLPTADFLADFTTTCVPGTIVFSDQSQPANAPLSQWEWNLAACGITNNTAPIPVTCTYTASGTYSASLTVTDANGCSATTTQTDLIEAFDKPDIQFSADNTTGCALPFLVNFSNDHPEPNTSYFWDFGNGTTFSGPHPGLVIYPADGVYRVVLTATNSLTGCVDSLVQEDFITVGHSMDIDVSAVVLCQGEEVQFKDLSPGAPDNRQWDFGDGNTSNKKQPFHTYAAPGCYTVSLTRIVNGCSRSITYPVCIQVRPLPTVSINNDNSLGCTLPHVVNFIAVAPTAVSWEWDFGDLNTSTTPNPTHLYNQFGDFQVSLTVTDGHACSNTFDNTLIRVQEVKASLDSNFFAGCTPLDFNISENSSTVTPITNWTWQVTTNMGVYTSSDSNAMFSIPDTGLWDVTLVVMNALGCMDSETFEEVVSVGMLPVVDFEANPLEECIETDVRFRDLSSDYGEEWRWDFGDTETSFLQNEVHQYQDTGFYDITLRVGHNGCYNSLTIPDYVHILEPLAKFDFDYDCDFPFRRNFTDRSIGAQSVHWDFGVLGVNDDTSNVFDPTFDFPGPGLYTVSMEVFNASTNCSHVETEEIEITLPAAAFTLDKTEGCAPLTVKASEASNFAMSWTWSAPGGDISNPNTPNPKITYDNPGKYTDIQLIIEDINACLDTFLFTDTIFVNGVEVDFSWTPVAGCRPLLVEVQDNSNSLFGTNTQWTWDFASGLGSGSGTQSNFVFDTLGQFAIRLTVRDDWGCFAVLEIPNAVEVTQPVAAFTATDTLACTAHCVQFSDASAGLDLDYLWDFGDGQSSTDPSPSHCYTAEGNFTVCLTVTDRYGCDSTFCRANYIEIRDPLAAFTVDQSQGTCPPFEVQFDNHSLHATSFVWDFGDGSDSSTFLSPLHIYHSPGSFDVQLIASNTPFCKDTLLIPNLIELLGPTGDFTFVVDSSCAPTLVTFTGNSAADYQYLWDFGDGTQDTLFTFQNTATVQHLYLQEGDYFPTLTLIDQTGCARSFDLPTALHISDIYLDFFTPDTLQCGENKAVNFLNLSFSNDLINGFTWQFPGGLPASSTDAEPMVTFPTEGAYEVILMAENEFCRDTLSRPDYIRIGPIPEASFAMDTIDGCNPLTINFTDNSTLSNGSLASYLWDYGDGSFDSIAHPSHLFNTAGVFDVRLTVWSDMGCADDTVQRVTIWQPLEVITSADASICIGETIVLSASIAGDTTGMVYFWEGGPDLSCTHCFETTVSPLDTSTYRFVVIDPQGCRSEGATTINVLPIPVPVVAISADTSICFGHIVQLEGSGGNNLADYQWDTSRPGLNCYASCVNPVASPTETTTYVLTISNSAGCTSQDSVTVTVVGQPEEFAGPDRTICEGDQIQLMIERGINPVWTAANGMSCVFCPDPLVSPDSTWSYEVKAESAEGCILTDSVWVEVIDRASVDAGEDQVSCRGLAVELVGRGEGVVTWWPADGLSDATVLQTQALPEENTTFYLEVKNGDCILTDTVLIEVVDQTVLENTAFEICAGEKIEISPLGNADVYQWEASNTLSAWDIATPTAQPTSTTTYQVIASQSTCTADTAEVLVEVIPAPAASLATSYYFFPGQSIQLHLDPSENPNLEYSWQPADLFTCPDCPNTSALPTQTSPIQLTVFDLETGCQQNLQSQLELLQTCPDDLLLVPSAFSPNNDGNNDELQIFASQAIQQIISFRLFNRWGAEVFFTNNIQQTWDGEYRGTPAPTGVYVYLIEAICPINGRRMIRTGDVFLLR